MVICSDAMARGLDLEGVQHVISYDPPVAPQTYVLIVLIVPESTQTHSYALT